MDEVMGKVFAYANAWHKMKMMEYLHRATEEDERLNKALDELIGAIYAFRDKAIHAAIAARSQKG